MSKKKILAAYEKLAEHYNAKIDHKPHNAYYDRPNTLNLIPEIQGKVILDAACGPGKYAETLLEQGAHVTGFDMSPSMIKLAKERNKGHRKKSSFFVHDLSHPLTEVAPNSYDVVICALAMHYLQNWDTAFQEFNRVLKPSGYLIISIEHPFFEYTYYNSTKYFEIEPVKCIWNGFGIPVEVNSFRRSLHDCITPLTANGFLIDKLVEPLPTKEFEALDPRHYNELMEFPAFLCIRAIPKFTQNQVR